jgi:hypothetical protein
MEKEQQKWKTTAKRFVAYVDIMGFKDMVARNSHKDILEIMVGMTHYLKNIEVLTADIESIPKMT